MQVAQPGPVLHYEQNVNELAKSRILDEPSCNRPVDSALDLQMVPTCSVQENNMKTM